MASAGLTVEAGGYIKKKQFLVGLLLFIAIMVTPHRVLSHCTLAPKEARLCGCPCMSTMMTV